MKYYIFSALLLLQFISSFGQSSDSKTYNKLVDSAFQVIQESREKANHFLNDIPHPAEDFIKNKFGRFYYVKAVIAREEGKLIKAHESFILSIKHAENEGDLKIAGDACHELALSLYSIEENEQAQFYIEKARGFYSKIDNEAGMLNLMQIPPYRKYLSYEFEECIELTMKHLETYESYKDDQYYNLLANFMLISSYIGLDNVDSVNKYFAKFRLLEPKVFDYDFNYFNNFLLIDQVSNFLEKDQIDSCLFYLSILENNIPELDNTGIKEIYLYYIDVYKKTNDKEKENKYVDLLKVLKEKVLQESVEGTFDIHKSLIETDQKLEIAKKSNRNVKIISGALFILLLFVFYLLYKRIVKNETLANKNLTSFIDSNHEKLKIKTKGLEKYIAELKAITKEIVNETDANDKENKITNLYKELHLKTADNSNASHFELASKLNAKYLIEIQRRHSQLSEPEVVLCYYIAIGFKNKEIASFLNSSIRSIESKRFRLSKKLEIPRDQNLFEYLNIIYKATY